MMDMWLFSESKLRTKFDTISVGKKLAEFLPKTCRVFLATPNKKTTIYNIACKNTGMENILV